MPRKRSVPLIGAHMSIAGGAHNAIDQGNAVNATALQMFTKNNNQWRAAVLTDEAIETFHEARRKSSIISYVGHTGYLINLASPKEDIYKKSVASLKEELDRAHKYQLTDLVLHPGAHLGEGEEYGIRKISESVNRIFDETSHVATRLSFEVTAGQGSSIGHKFEQIAELIDLVHAKERLSVCFDTCHAFAAGYELRNKRAWNKTFREFDEIVGLDYLRVFHVNDSKREHGSRVDRHANLGEGELGLEPFKFLMQDKRFKDIPKILETPKGDDPEGNDRRNLDILRSFN
jgi:deoxyribonuclease-4